MEVAYVGVLSGLTGVSVGGAGVVAADGVEREAVGWSAMVKVGCVEPAGWPHPARAMLAVTARQAERISKANTLLDRAECWAMNTSGGLDVLGNPDV